MKFFTNAMFINGYNVVQFVIISCSSIFEWRAKNSSTIFARVSLDCSLFSDNELLSNSFVPLLRTVLVLVVLWSLTGDKLSGWLTLYLLEPVFSLLGVITFTGFSLCRSVSMNSFSLDFSFTSDFDSLDLSPSATSSFVTCKQNVWHKVLLECSYNE